MASDLVWTNHLEQRLLQRGISRNEAYDAIRHPDQSIRLSSTKWKLIKSYPHKRIVVIAVKQQHQWIILSAWTKNSHNSKSFNQEHSVTRFFRNLLVKGVDTLAHLIKR